MAQKRYSLSENEDSYSVYSDDFDSASRVSSPHHSNGHKRLGGNKRKELTSHSEYESEASSKSLRHEPRRKPYRATAASTKYSWKTRSSDSKRKNAPFKGDSVQSRVLSAQRSRINNLGNELGEARIKIDELVKENRMLKTLQKRQEKSLRKFEDTEGDLPRLISQHMDDQRVLKARLRKAQDAERLADTQLKESNDEVKRMENTLRRLKKIIYDKNLGERSELAKQLSKTEEKLIEAERKNKELEKKLALTTQSYSRQLRSEQVKHKETKLELESLKARWQETTLKLKEKERALEVSNIYSLRSKQSPEKSFVGKLAVSTRSTEKSSPRRHEPLPLTLEESPVPLEPKPEQPSPRLIAVAGEVQDHRKTIKSPLKTPIKRTSSEPTRKDSNLIDLSDKKTYQITSQLNEMRLESDKNQDQPVENASKHQRSVFLTSNYSPNTTFVSDRAPSPKLPPPTQTTKPRTPTPEKDKVLAELEAKQLEEERKKLEEERKKKAVLLAKMKALEEEENVSSSAKKKKDDDDLKKLLNTDSKPIHHHRSLFKEEVNGKNPRDSETDERKQLIEDVSNFSIRSPKSGSCRRDNLDVSERNMLEVLLDHSYDSLADGSYLPSNGSYVYERYSTQRSYSIAEEVENLHKGLPATGDLKKSKDFEDEPEISFGSYAPTVAAAPKRKPLQPPKKQLALSSESDPDEPLLDLESGKVASKDSNLLQQLFGEQASSTTVNGPVKKESSFSSSRGSQPAKPTPRAKPIHSGYPWERNVVAASEGHVGNGDAHSTPKKRGVNMETPVIKAVRSFNDDDIEELTL